MRTNIPHNAITGAVYQGENAARLFAASQCREWATFLQWRSVGYAVKKGEHGQKIRVYPTTTAKDEKTGQPHQICTPRSYVVFNRGQVTH